MIFVKKKCGADQHLCYLLIDNMTLLYFIGILLNSSCPFPLSPQLISHALIVSLISACLILILYSCSSILHDSSINKTVSFSWFVLHSKKHVPYAPAVIALLQGQPWNCST